MDHIIVIVCGGERLIRCVCLVDKRGRLELIHRHEPLLLVVKGSLSLPIVELLSDLGGGALLGHDVESDPESGNDHQNHKDDYHGDHSAVQATCVADLVVCGHISSVLIQFLGSVSIDHFGVFVWVNRISIFIIALVLVELLVSFRGVRTAVIHITNILLIIQTIVARVIAIRVVSTITGIVICRIISTIVGIITDFLLLAVIRVNVTAIAR